MKLNWLWRSVLMEEAGDGGTGGGGGGNETALATTTGTDITTTDDGAGAGDGTTAITTTEGDAAAPIFEGGKLSQSASKTFRKLEVANPDAKPLLSRAQRAFGTVAKLTAMFGPKPFDRINALRKMERELETHAYVNNEGKRIDGLTALREINDDVAAHDDLYANSDPRLLGLMTESPAGKNAYVKLWPHVVAKLRDLAPKMYTRWLGAQTVSLIEKSPITLKSQDGKDLATEAIDLPFRLRRMVGQIPWTVDKESGKYVGGTLTPEQVQALAWDMEFINAFVMQVRGWANETPEDLTPPKEDTSAAAVAKAQEDASQALEQAWMAKRDAICNRILEDQVREQTKGMSLSSLELANVTAAARRSVNETRRNTPDNRTKQYGYLKAKDVKGYLAYNKKIFEDHSQAAVEKAIATYAKRSTRRTPAASGTTGKATTTQAGAPDARQTQQQPSGQVRRLTAKESADLGGRTGTRWIKQKIGNSPGTTTEMIFKGQHMLRAGNPLNLPEGTVVQHP